MSLEHPLVSDTANIAFFIIFVVNHGVKVKHHSTKWYAKTDFMRQRVDSHQSIRKQDRVFRNRGTFMVHPIRGLVMRNIHRSVGIWQRTHSPNQQRRLLFRNSGPKLVIKIHQHLIRRIPKFGRWRPGVAPSNLKGPLLQCDRRPLLVKKELDYRISLAIQAQASASASAWWWFSNW